MVNKSSYEPHVPCNEECQTAFVGVCEVCKEPAVFKKGMATGGVVHKSCHFSQP